MKNIYRDPITGRFAKKPSTSKSSSNRSSEPKTKIYLYEIDLTRIAKKISRFCDHLIEDFSKMKKSDYQ